MTHVSGRRLTLLDGFTLRLGDSGPGSSTDLPRAVQRLVAHLSLSRRRARTAVAGQLWPDVSEEHAHGSLRSALWRVHKVAPGLVEVSGETLCLAEDVHVDVHELTTWACRALDPTATADDLTAADFGLPGELLPGWYDDWVLLERERLRQLRMHALEALADKYARAGRYGEAVQAAYAAVRAEPLRESAHRTVIRIHLAEGNVTEAVREYESFRALLAAELDVAPSPLMVRLIGGVPGRHRGPAVAPLPVGGRASGSSIDGCVLRAGGGVLGSSPDAGDGPRSGRSSEPSGPSTEAGTRSRTST